MSTLLTLNVSIFARSRNRNVLKLASAKTWSNAASSWTAHQSHMHMLLTHIALSSFTATLAVSVWQQTRRSEKVNIKQIHYYIVYFSALTLLVGQQEEHMACKNRVVGRTCYLSGARRRLAYGPADAIATHCILYRLTRVVLDKGPINGCVCTLYTTQYFTGQMPFLSPNQQSQSTEGRCWVVGCWHGYVWSKVQTCIWPSWCYCHSLSLATAKSTLVLSFWYRLTPVVPEKGPLNGCVFVHCILNSKTKQQCTAGSATGWHSLHDGVI